MSRFAAICALMLGAPAVAASPCGPMDIPNGAVLSEFDQVFLDKDWDSLGRVLPLVDPSAITSLTIQLANAVEVDFTACETVFVEPMPPLTYRRANVYYSPAGVGLITYMDVMILQGEATIVNFRVETSFTTMMELIR